MIYQKNRNKEKSVQFFIKMKDQNKVSGEQTYLAKDDCA
jgi:hypothetical protein